MVCSGTSATAGLGKGSLTGSATDPCGRFSTGSGAGGIAGSAAGCWMRGCTTGCIPIRCGWETCGVGPMNLFTWATFLLSRVPPCSMTTRSSLLDTTLYDSGSYIVDSLFQSPLLATNRSGLPQCRILKSLLIGSRPHDAFKFFEFFSPTV